MLAALAGAAVAVALGVYGRQHDPAGQALFTLGFSGTINMKAWLATLVLAARDACRSCLALWMFGKIGRKPAPAWIGPVHRLVGTLAFLVSLPIAYHCLWSLGFERHPDQARRFWHSLFGYAFYGAFTIKVLCVRSSTRSELGAARRRRRGVRVARRALADERVVVLQQLRLPELLEVAMELARPTSCVAVQLHHRRRDRGVRDPVVHERAAEGRARCPKTGAPVGAAIFATRCASCHGADGGGGFGPTLAGVVTSRFPNPADQEAVVANGRGAMPSFSDSLTPEQIAAVVEFTRTGLG